VQNVSPLFDRAGVPHHELVGLNTVTVSQTPVKAGPVINIFPLRDPSKYFTKGKTHLNVHVEFYNRTEALI
jgi:hypothetical protein